MVGGMNRTDLLLLAARRQEGVVTRRQALDAGISPEVIRSRLATGRWQRLSSGVYATISGPLTEPARLWAALLRAGPGAVAGPSATLWLAGALDRPPDPWDVVIPVERRVRAGSAIHVLRRHDVAAVRHPAAWPPRLRLEVAVLDATAVARRDEEAVDLVVRVVQRGLTTADRLAAALRDRARPPPQATPPGRDR
jgi:Transcriptional regulator, AbiEi antitoxin